MPRGVGKRIPGRNDNIVTNNKMERWVTAHILTF